LPDSASEERGPGAADGGDEARWEEEFEQLVCRIGDTPWMAPHQGRRIWRHFLRFRPELALDVGTCYGTSAAYMAGACKINGVGRVVTVDSGQFDEAVDVVKWCQVLWDRCGVSDYIDMVRIPHSNYAWWLMEQVAARSSSGTCEPAYDFAYLDGAKLLALDTAAVVFIEQLLRPGGWLLMDDLDWTAEQHPEMVPVVVYPATETSYRFSEAERTTAHLRAVFDLVVKQHPSFTTFIEQDGQWGWAQKLPGARRLATIEVLRARPSWIDQLGRVVSAVARRRARH
jgi:predicted O-methyltransferase YrrM